jgi:hypothetical protein
MAITGTTTDYTGRKKDISVLQYPDGAISGPQPVVPAFGKVTRFCTGIQKLAQKYAVILMTNVSSQENYPEFGTSLLYTLKRGISPTDRLAASQIFRLASYIAVQAIKSYQIDRSDIPSDERIVNAELTDLVLYGGYAAFDVTITTEAGSLKYIVPLPK